MGRAKPGSTGTSSRSSMSGLLVVIAACVMHLLFGWISKSSIEYSQWPSPESGTPIPLDSNQWYKLTRLCEAEDSLKAERKGGGDASQRKTADSFRKLRNAAHARDDAKSDFTKSFPQQSALSKEKREARREFAMRRYAEQGKEGFRLQDQNTLRGALGSSPTGPTHLSLLTGIMGCWFLMLLCQGEGLELDIQRRRYPMWEWLLSHPVNPAQVFYIDLLSPLLSNPIYLFIPLYLWVLFGSLYGVLIGLLGALLAGLPLAVGLSAANKAIETYALLRLDVRVRGAVLGILSWFGYSVMILPFLLLQMRSSEELIESMAVFLARWLPIWQTGVLLGGWSDSPSLWQALIAWWLLALGLIALSVFACSRFTVEGFQASSESSGPKRSSLLRTGGQLGKNPLRRKELLWLIRDRGAIIQIVLIPLTVAMSQMLNFTGVLRYVTMSWTLLCGLAIIVGTYFLLVLGPRSLVSEGPALWLTLTWPRGLEDLLKEKARLWSNLSNAIVGLALSITILIFPADWWKIVIVGIGWLVFSSTLALKSVSLVTVPSSSGETEPPDRAARWFSMLGTLSFAAGLLTGTWQVAVMGIVFSSLVSVAMWERMKARLPYIFDTWSIKAAPAPSLIQVTVGIALLMEFIGVCMVVAHVFSGKTDGQWFAWTLGYGSAVTLGCLCMQLFLHDYGVSLRSILVWESKPRSWALGAGNGLGVLCGVVLALLALVYQYLLPYSPWAAEAAKSVKQISDYRDQALWIFLVVSVFAPIAEEYFFRGLLFRTLDRDLGDWRALVLSAASFTVLHPPLSWVPVFLVGLCSAWLFKNTRHLVPSVLLHATYNAIVVGVPLFAT